MNNKKNIQKLLILFFFFTSYSIFSLKKKLHAAEAGASFYTPGLYGDIAVAIPPSAGTYLLSTSIFYPSKTVHPILPNSIDNSIKADTFAQLLRGFYVPQSTFMGANMLFAFRVLTLDTNVIADVQTPSGDVIVREENSSYGDLGVIPLSLYWKWGNVYFNLYEAINIPTGDFESGKLSNVVLGRWVFDSVLGITWLDTNSGIEVSFTPGITYNLENENTNYKTGIEFHMDWMLNWHFNKSWAVGLHGSVYQQLTADKGADPSLGSFKSRAFTIGPSITWHKDIGSQKYFLSAKWLHEFDARNKVEGDFSIISLGIKF